ncbi:MAG TPA: SOS response-associated peptidase [Candidatus Ozemobacteraceae bacterium]|nr:SOS response-associated peptidase [Candidatus Ozemobacteraceae bacterium]HQG29039.1 SOS response-associated peptidase [Candidatus Ozemobacteraceae bacterium]
MCGRFSLIATWQSLLDAMKAEPLVQYTARYNIAPSQPVLLLRRNASTGSREFAHALWGFLPSWAGEKPVKPLINARSETAATKPAFRTAFRRRRCLVPATGFYEWKAEAGKRNPWYFRMRDGGLFAFAGLWETSVSPDGGEFDTCTILTTSPNELVAAVHDRMPCILPPESWPAWLGTGEEPVGAGEIAAIQSLLGPFPAGPMIGTRVSAAVNSATAEGPGCIAPPGPKTPPLPL